MSYPQEAFSSVTLTPGSILARRRATVFNSTLHYQLKVLKETGRYEAFKLKWHPSYAEPPDSWPVPNHLFWDSDVAKWIEGACYLLHDQNDAEIDFAVKELVDMIRGAQQDDGYINIHFTVVEPGKRFTNLRDLHELYNAGHLIEAALAHNYHYKTDDLLAPMMKYVKLLARTFGSRQDQVHGYPGHPEIELALLRLYNRTGDADSLNLARYFIQERGNPTGQNSMHFYVAEAQARRDDPNKWPVYWPSKDCLWYYQAHRPILRQNTIEGHSVRAMYLLTAAADLVRIDNETSLKSALYTLWDNMVDCKMYLTGGIGAMKQWEGFGPNHFLPQSTDEGGCYAETCAAIGVMMLAQRILQYDLSGRFGDIMELCLYNSVLTAMSCDGKQFTYVNQLASSESDLSKRERWFKCACCPPNVLRLLGQIGGYIYDTKPGPDTFTIHTHLFVSSTLDFEVGGAKCQFSQETKWPWSGTVSFCLKKKAQDVAIKIRIPAWAPDWKITPSFANEQLDKGYLTLPPSYVRANPEFQLEIQMKPRLLAPHPWTSQPILAVARGPLVYCVEDTDNPWVRHHFKEVQIDSSCTFKETMMTDEQTGEDYLGISVTEGANLFDMSDLHGFPHFETALLQKQTEVGKGNAELD